MHVHVLYILTLAVHEVCDYTYHDWSIWSTQSSPLPPGPDDLEGVDRVSSSMEQTWYDFGAFIGVKVSHLEDLKRMPSGQMSRIMRWWIGGDTDKFDYFMEPRWHTLVKAIAHPAGGNSVSVAEEIAMTHQVTEGIRTCHNIGDST